MDKLVPHLWRSVIAKGFGVQAFAHYRYCAFCLYCQRGYVFRAYAYFQEQADFILRVAYFAQFGYAFLELRVVAVYLFVKKLPVFRRELFTEIDGCIVV